MPQGLLSTLIWAVVVIVVAYLAFQALTAVIH